MLAVVKELENESESIEKNLIEILWYMRGGITLNDAYDLTFDQRKFIFELIKENTELSKKTGKPIY